MKQKLYDLKMQILKEKGISDWLKKELAEQIFQIEKELAINYTDSCAKLKTEQECYKTGRTCMYRCKGLCKDAC